MTGHGGTADDDAQGYEIELGSGRAPGRADEDARRSAPRRPSRRWWLAGGALAALLATTVTVAALRDDAPTPPPLTAQTTDPTPSAIPPTPSDPASPDPSAAPPDPSAAPPEEIAVDEVVLPPDALRTEPSQGWSLDAAALTDEVGRARAAAGLGEPYAGSVSLARGPAGGTSSTGGTVVAVVGAGTDRAMIVGVDARRGDVRWRLPEPGAHVCQYISGGHAVFCATGSPAADTGLVLVAGSGDALGRWTGMDCLPLRAAGTPARLVVAGRGADDSPCLARGDIAAAGPEAGLTYSPEDGKDPLDSYRVYEPVLTVRDDAVLFWAPPVVLSTTTSLSGFSAATPDASGYLHPSGLPVTTTPLAPHATQTGFNDTVTTLPAGATLDGSPWTHLDGPERSSVVGVGDAALDAGGKTLWEWETAADADAFVETYLSADAAVRVTYAVRPDTGWPDLTAVAVAPESGDPLWQVERPESTLSPVLALDGVLLWVDQRNIGTGQVVAQDATTGEWLWTEELGTTAEGALFAPPELQVVGDVVVRSFADRLSSLAF